MPPIQKPKHNRQNHFLRQWRKFRGKTQAQVADALEVDQSTISNLERKISPYDQDILERLATYYGCDPEDLLAIDPLKPDPPRVVYDKLRDASPAMQRRAIDVLEALLKAG